MNNNWQRLTIDTAPPIDSYIWVRGSIDEQIPMQWTEDHNYNGFSTADLGVDWEIMTAEEVEANSEAIAFNTSSSSHGFKTVIRELAKHKAAEAVAPTPEDWLPLKNNIPPIATWIEMDQMDGKGVQRVWWGDNFDIDLILLMHRETVWRVPAESPSWILFSDAEPEKDQKVEIDFRGNLPPNLKGVLTTWGGKYTVQNFKDYLVSFLQARWRTDSKRNTPGN